MLRTATGTYTVESVHRMEGSRFANADPVGYTVTRAGSVLAALLLFDPSID